MPNDIAGLVLHFGHYLIEFGYCLGICDAVVDFFHNGMFFSIL